MEIRTMCSNLSLVTFDIAQENTEPLDLESYRVLISRLSKSLETNDTEEIFASLCLLGGMSESNLERALVLHRKAREAKIELQRELSRDKPKIERLKAISSCSDEHDEIIQGHGWKVMEKYTIRCEKRRDELGERFGMLLELFGVSEQNKRRRKE